MFDRFCHWKNLLHVIVFFFFFCFFFSFTSLSSFFTHIETNQLVGGAKTGVPGEKPPDTPASRTWLVSHMIHVIECDQFCHWTSMIHMTKYLADFIIEKV